MEEQGIEDEGEVRPPLPPGFLPKSAVRRPKDTEAPKETEAPEDTQAKKKNPKNPKNKKSWVLLVNRTHVLDITSM